MTATDGRPLPQRSEDSDREGELLRLADDPLLLAGFIARDIARGGQPPGICGPGAALAGALAPASAAKVRRLSRLQERYASARKDPLRNPSLEPVRYHAEERPARPWRELNDALDGSGKARPAVAPFISGLCLFLVMAVLILGAVIART